MADWTLAIKYCEPFNGSLAANGVIAAWLLSKKRIAALAGRSITEQELYDFIVETEPRHFELFRLAMLNIDAPPARV